MTDTLDIQISIEEGDWPEEASLLALCEPVLAAAETWLKTKESQPFPKHPVELSLLFTNDASIREINAEWREQDKPTNVLSFPAYPLEPGGMPGPMLGDIIFAYETVAREAAELEKPFEAHLSHLLVHGFLHLFGYDHMNDEEATIMEGLETRILLGLGLSDPYAGTELT
ncbi:rRNA maturation RNase YbeY [Rhizobium sp. C4]|uniref:rRNA maturation RNase YbeY n=1 Tax=Rhizobium sp. C4 TaxID=1349800 RepID=UPI001E512DDC|nr:rRNA maturation RNase YbeY [Rhizobium sp. C4]MCD2174502.1 rRNA maturation RNase YbeY [Rhizobium sp. C4]